MTLCDVSNSACRSRIKRWTKSNINVNKTSKAEKPPKKAAQSVSQNYLFRRNGKPSTFLLSPFIDRSMKGGQWGTTMERGCSIKLRDAHYKISDVTIHLIILSRGLVSPSLPSELFTPFVFPISPAEFRAE